MTDAERSEADARDAEALADEREKAAEALLWAARYHREVARRIREMATHRAWLRWQKTRGESGATREERR